MGRIIIELKDPEKGDFLFELLAQLDFISVEKEDVLTTADPVHEENQIGNSLLEAAGLWKDRAIDAGKLRAQAWRNQN